MNLPERFKGSVHHKVTGATLGAAISGLVAAELTHRLHLQLLPEEIVAIGMAGTFAGGWLKRCP